MYLAHFHLFCLQKNSEGATFEHFTIQIVTTMMVFDSNNNIVFLLKILEFFLKLST